MLKPLSYFWAPPIYGAATLTPALIVLAWYKPHLRQAASPALGTVISKAEQLGKTVSPDSRMESGDFIFWKGHIALAVDADTLIHANAFHMACVCEPLDAAIKRIKDQGDGDITAHKRLFSVN